MAHRCARKLRLAKLSSSLSGVRYFHPTSSAFDAVPSESSTSASCSSSAESPLETIRQRKAGDLRSFLSLRTPNPQHIWGNYIELLQFYGTTRVPLDIHQAVLRKCAPPAAHIRAMAARRRASGRKYKEDRVYELRFQTVIRNIRSTGDIPALEDYHCVLELFAAVGNHVSAMMVLQEIRRVGLAKEPRTYALCLQALCHRLSLPTWHLNRPDLVNEMTKHCLTILKEMASEGVPYTSYNVDFAFRILKETTDMEGFSMIMRNAYGIDLAYPDRSPLENWDKPRTAPSDADVEAGSPIPFAVPTQLPFSRAAFNTAIDYLGRVGNVSKLVQTFEVVTAPLPSPNINSAFDDDDDDDFGVSNPQVAPYKPPHIHPNTASFRLLLKWLSKASHAVLARHYLTVALAKDREQGQRLRELAFTQPPDQVPSPHLSINRSVLLPVFSLANRYKNMELLRWVIIRVKRVARRKRVDLEHFSRIREKWISDGVYQRRLSVESDLSDEINEDLPSAATSSKFSSFFTFSSSLRNQATDASTSPLPHFNLDAPAVPPPEEQKIIDIDLHLTMLRRELLEMMEFEKHAETVLARNTQRIKERLGRRVWAGKNVFMRDVGRRTVVSKEAWRVRVNFRTQDEIEGQRQSRMSRSRQRPLEPAKLSTGEKLSDSLPHQDLGDA